MMAAMALVITVMMTMAVTTTALMVLTMMAVATAALMALVTMTVAMIAAALVLATVIVVVAAMALVLLTMVVAAIALLVVLVGGGVQRPIQAGGNRIGLLLIKQRDSLRTELAASDCLEHVIQRKSGVCTGKGDLALLGNGKCKTQVLEEVLNQEAGLVVALEALGGKRLHGTGAARAGADHRAHLLNIQAVLLGK